MTPEESQALLADQVYAPAFFHKLARAYGIAPRDPEEAAKLMTIGQRALALAQVDQSKTASARSDALDRINEQLGAALGMESGSHARSAGVDPFTVKAASDLLAAAPELRVAAAKLRELGASGY